METFHISQKDMPSMENGKHGSGYRLITLSKMIVVAEQKVVKHAMFFHFTYQACFWAYMESFPMESHSNLRKFAHFSIQQIVLQALQGL